MTDFDDDGKRHAEQAVLDRDDQQRQADDIISVMGTEEGRRVVWSLLEQGRVFSAILPGDALVMSFMEGQRNLALTLFQRVMTSCPQQYLKMAEEAGEQE